MAIEVDPYEALLNLALGDTRLTDVVGTQIDMRHHYGQDSEDGYADWDPTSQALTFTPVGGLRPDWYDQVQRVQIEARCYGDTELEATAVYRALIDFSRMNEKAVIAVTGGEALVYVIYPIGSPQLIVEPEVRPNGGIPVLVVRMGLEVSECLVS